MYRCNHSEASVLERLEGPELDLPYTAHANRNALSIITAVLTSVW